MNHITVAGHLGADPEVRFTSSGQKVTTLRVGAKVRKTSKEEATVWWRVTIWGEAFDKMMQYFKKGSSIIAMGDMSKPEIFTDKEGKPQVSMNITAFHLSFSPFGRGESSSSSSQVSHAGAKEPELAYSVQETAGQMDVIFSDEEMPF
jgi:single-strand DNA-binding protein